MATRGKPTRRTLLAGLGGAALGSAALGVAGGRAQPPGEPRPGFEGKIPVSGKAGPGLEPLDDAMLEIMERHGVPGAALAIAKGGKLVLARGYGWANVAAGTAVKPDTLFGLASLSKVVTSAAVLKLVEQEKLDLDAPVFELLKHIKPPAGARTDPQLAKVTVRHCLNHSGGWDRAVRGDPINWEPQICRAMRVRPPLTPTQFLSFTLTLPLDFAPGTLARYSNVGFVAAGEVVAKVSGRPYAEFAAEHVLKPAGVKALALHPAAGKYLAGEAVRHLAGTFVGLPPMRLPMVDAAGGWTGSAVDVARLLTSLDGSRGEPVLGEKARRLMIEPAPPPVKPLPDGSHVGLGWDSVFGDGKAYGYFKDGSYQGMRTFMKRLPNGVNWVLLYNASMEFDPHDLKLAASTVHEVRGLVEKIEKYPDVDLFDEFR